MKDPVLHTVAWRTAMTIGGTRSRVSRRACAAGLLAAAVVLTVAGCSGPGASSATAAPRSLPGRGKTSRWGQTRYARAARRPAPTMSGRTLDGARLSTADLKARLLVVNVWASWCGPCEEEAPTLAAVDAEFRDRGVRFVGLDVRDDPTSAREFDARFSIRYPSIVDQDGSIAARLRPWLPGQAIPGTVVIDRDGRVAASVIGKVRRSVLTATLEDLLAERRQHR